MSLQYNISWDEFHRATLQLAELCADHSFEQIIAVARGGLIPAGILARELNVRLVDTLCITSYQNEQQGDLEILKNISGTGEGLLIVDDLVDTGNTAKLIRELLPQATLAVVYAKPQGKPYCDLYIEDTEQDTWLNFPWDTQVQFSEPLIKE